MPQIELTIEGGSQDDWRNAHFASLTADLPEDCQIIESEGYHFFLIGNYKTGAVQTVLPEVSAAFEVIGVTSASRQEITRPRWFATPDGRVFYDRELLLELTNPPDQTVYSIDSLEDHGVNLINRITALNLVERQLPTLSR